MFDWKARLEFLKEHPRFNNASQYGVKVIPKENSNWVASVYHLTPDENRGGHFIYLDVICKQNEREPYRAINWGWRGMTPTEANQIGAIFPDKPPNEIKSHPIFEGQYIWLEVAGGDRVEGLHTAIDPDMPASDGTPGNTRFHHSYLVLFREVDKDPPSEPPDPDPEPTPDDPPSPNVALTGEIMVMVNKEWVTGLRPNDQGNVTFIVSIREVKGG